MTKDELKTQFPELYKEVKAEGAAEFKESVKTPEALATEFPEASGKLAQEKADGATASERQRIVEIQEAAFPGQEAVVRELVTSGAAVPEATKKLMADEKDKRSQSFEDLKKSDPGNLGKNTKGDDLGKASGDFEGKVQEIMKERKLSRGEAVKAVVKEFPDLHEAYLKNLQGQKG